MQRIILSSANGCVSAKKSRKKTEKAEIFARSALLKTRKNLILGRGSFPLTSDENKYFCRSRPFMTTHWIDTDKIIYALVDPEKKGQLIVYDSIRQLDLFALHSTSVFIQELVVHKIPLEETTLYRSMSECTSIRPVMLDGKRVKLPLNTHENMLAYFDKCQSLIKSIQEGGVKQSPDENIGIAITSAGIAHFRLGHHRLAIAQALRLKKIPIDIILISAQFLFERLPRWRLWSAAAMVRAVDDVLRDTMDNLNNGC